MALSAPVTAYTSLIPGGASWDPFFTVLASWLVANATVPSLGLIAPSSAGPVTGTATITASTDAATMLALGTQVATAVLGASATPDAIAAAAPYWGNLSKSVITSMVLPAQVLPGTMQTTNTPSSPGVVTGTGVFVPASGPAALTALVIANLPVTDAAGQAAWLLPSTQILLWLTAATVVTFSVPPVAPAGGGPIVGTFSLL